MQIVLQNEHKFLKFQKFRKILYRLIQPKNNSTYVIKIGNKPYALKKWEKSEIGHKTITTLSLVSFHKAW